jgi:ABC-type lipoprotein export system ATPase subunit
MIKVKNLTKTYHNGKIETKVLKGVDLNVEPSEWILIDGPRGSGKSTLMNILCGLDEAHKGFIYLDETEIAEIDLATLGQIVEFVKAGREFILEDCSEEKLKDKTIKSLLEI